jgi:hypothetical protein
MGIKAIPTKDFILFLESKGLVYRGTKASHDKYDRIDKPLKRPVIIRSNYKEIPLLHIHTNLKTLGVSKEEFNEFLRNL